MAHFKSKAIPFLLVHNKSDLQRWQDNDSLLPPKTQVLDYSSVSHEDPWQILRALKRIVPESAFNRQSLIGDLVSYGDIVMMIVPIDLEAPEGRLILPQVQAIRDILDNDAVAIVLKDREVDVFLRNTQIKPSLVITDSSIFNKAGRHDSGGYTADRIQRSAGAVQG